MKNLIWQMENDLLSSIILDLLLSHRDRGHSRACAALNLQRLRDERELVDALRRKLVQLQVLQQVNAVYYEHYLMDRKRELRVRVGIYFHRNIVGPDQH